MVYLCFLKKGIVISMNTNILDVVIADPAGNITAFVLNEDVKREDYIEISNKIMAIEKYKVEQVGFIHTSEKTGEERMDMMGGEFCGNASRSFGLYLAKKRGLHGKNTVSVDVSGTKDPLSVEVDTDIMHAKTTMPLPQRIDYIEFEGKSIPAVVFEGIVHLITMDIEINEAVFERIKAVVTEKYAPEAFGVMILKKAEEYITPIVYVKETNSTIYESSCGSGSIATAIYLSHKNTDGDYTHKISQPGGTIEVTVQISGGKFTRTTIGGAVSIDEAVQIEV